MSTDQNFEDKLDSWRQEAKHGGAVTGRGVDVAGGPIPKRPGYYGEAVVRPPVWTWEIPLYFFIGGAAGMAPLFACAGFFLRMLELARAALWIAAAGAIISPILLVMDLGRPAACSSTCCAFSNTGRPCRSAPGFFPFLERSLFRRVWFSSSISIKPSPVRSRLLSSSLPSSSPSGRRLPASGLATYTGVLIGATVIPAWFLHRVLLPIHFGTAGLGWAAAILELLGFQIRPLFLIGMLAAIIETLLWIWLEMDKHGAGDRALHEGRSGWLIRGGEIFSGPLADHSSPNESGSAGRNLLFARRVPEPLRLDRRRARLRAAIRKRLLPRKGNSQSD